ncbi:PIN domain-containing protein [Streptomyces sp. st115]|uniref:PIN domain-containing protein n=1 Tax=Streptomyces sp. st115 TaxID=1828047 RepID=UPI000BF00ADD|nr:PIN domain-containing protein [Streptomyces sp. st115]
MIILDTCVIRSMNLDGSEAHLLRAIRDTKAERVGVPWMVMEERAAQLAIKYRQTHAKAAQAVEQLRAISSDAVPELPQPDEEAVREKFRKRLRGLAEVIKPSQSVLEEGLFRESNELPPAGQKKSEKVGARDAVIWLSAVEYAKENPGEKVYFVSSNTSDFTAGDGPYPFPMDQDLEGIWDRFVHLPQLADLLKVVAPSVEVASERVLKLLPSFIKHFLRAATAGWGSPVQAMFHPFPALSQAAGTAKEAYGWYGPEQATRLKALKATDVQGYRLGDQEWCTASVQWQVTGWTRFTDVMDMGCSIWDTRILLPLVEDGPSPRILWSEKPKAPADPASIDWSGSGLLRDHAHLPETQRLLDSLRSGSQLERTLAMISYSLQSILAGGNPVTELDVRDALAARRMVGFDDMDPDERAAAVDAARDEALKGYEDWPGPEEHEG